MCCSTWRSRPSCSLIPWRRRTGSEEAPHNSKRASEAAAREERISQPKVMTARDTLYKLKRRRTPKSRRRGRRPSQRRGRPGRSVGSRGREGGRGQGDGGPITRRDHVTRALLASRRRCPTSGPDQCAAGDRKRLGRRSTGRSWQQDWLAFGAVSVNEPAGQTREQGGEVEATVEMSRQTWGCRRPPRKSCR